MLNKHSRISPCIRNVVMCSVNRTSSGFVIIRSLIILRSVCEAFSHYVQYYGTEDFSIRSFILLCSECRDLLGCSVCAALSYYVQNVETYQAVQYVQPYRIMFRMQRPIRLFSTRSLIVLCSECRDLLGCSVRAALSYYVQNVETYQAVQYAQPYRTMFRMYRPIRLFSMRSLIVLCSECGDLLNCSVCAALSYYVQNVETYQTVQYVQPYRTMFRL